MAKNALLADEKIIGQQQRQIADLQAAIEELKRPKNGVRYNGQLYVEGTRLLNHTGDPIQLRGMSSHGIMWFPEFTNYRAVASTRDHGANVFRIAMYTDPEKGYASYPEESEKALYMALENTLGADMYAIIDWHVLKDEDPNLYVSEAMDFFQEVSAKYAHEPGVIYEICNEPNGNTTWEDIKNYAHQVIPIIRKNAPNAIILVGTPNHCTDIEEAADDPLPYDNILYTYHFYTGYDRGGYRKSLSYALERNIPVFISEWGLSYEENTKSIDYGKAREFISFLNKNGVGWVNWSLCNKDEEHSAIHSTSESLSGWSEEDLTESGLFVFEMMARKE
jgi:aryl-phospho-beta-D-glucosidase BglC (GH1 family)